MTFKNLQDRALARLRLTTTAARTRVKDRINERLRAIQTGIGLTKTRYGTLSINTVAATATMATTGIVKAFTVTIPLQNRVLTERTVEYFRTLDPSNTSSGTPLEYAIEKMGATTSTIRFYPIPDAIYAVQIDGLLVGTDLSLDADIPGIPEDFHDILIDGAMADEYGDMEDAQDKVTECEMRFDKRLRDLRYFISKSAWLSRRQGGDSGHPAWLVNLGHWIG